MTQAYVRPTAVSEATINVSIFSEGMLHVGVLGHVDSGKTSLVRALHETLAGVLSTAALDKHPQSKQRGITLDLGFSSVVVDAKRLVFVDCPGHASLVKTVIGSAAIIDCVLLVIDAAKGVQVQTVECLALAECTVDHLVVVLNKVDLVTPSKLLSLEKNLRSRVFSKTKFGSDVPVLTTSATDRQGITDLSATLGALVPRSRPRNLPFVFSFDHMFTISGQGCVFAGTCLQGSVRVGDTVEVVTLNDGDRCRRVKSIQVFKENVKEITSGDRAAICVPKIAKLERGLIVLPSSSTAFNVALVQLQRVRFFKGAIRHKSSFHVSIGHSHCQARILLLKPDHHYREPILQWLEETTCTFGEQLENTSVAVLCLNSRIRAPGGSVLLGSRMDLDTSDAQCRIAFHGRILSLLDAPSHPASSLIRMRKTVQRELVVDRVKEHTTTVCKGHFTSQAHALYYQHRPATNTMRGLRGHVSDSFGTTGKVLVVFEAEGSEKGDRVVVDHITTAPLKM